MWGRYCAWEIFIANPIDWLFAACLEYFIIFSIDSSEARKQYDEYCLSIMQTITYAHDRMHFQCTTCTHFWSKVKKFNLGAKGETLYILWKCDVKFRDPQIQIHSSIFLHFYTYVYPLFQIRIITKLQNSEQSYKGKVKTHKYINRQNQSTTGKLWKP